MFFHLFLKNLVELGLLLLPVGEALLEGELGVLVLGVDLEVALGAGAHEGLLAHVALDGLALLNTLLLARVALRLSDLLSSLLTVYIKIIINK